MKIVDGLMDAGCFTCSVNVVRLDDILREEFYDAIRDKEFVVYYQPIVDIVRSKCVGVEALIRWEKEDGEIVGPDQFVKKAERCGVMPLITRFLMETVISDMKRFLVRDPDFHVSINLSSTDFESVVSLQILHRLTEAAGIHPKQIWLETPENGFRDKEAAIDILCKAQKIGYLIAVDDFGVGLSGLSCLNEMPLNVLKIDRVFVSEIGSGRTFSTVIDYVISIAKEFGLKIVAEGVELREQFEYLKKHGVEYSQGWMHAPAMPLRDFYLYYAGGES